MGQSQYIQFIVRTLGLIVNGILIYSSIVNQYTITIIGLSLCLLFQMFLFIEYLKKQFADIEKTVDCLLYDDFSNTIQKQRNSTLHNKVAKLLKKRRKESLERTSETLIFSNIIESLSIGILILRKDTSDHIDVFQINKAFTEFLKIPKYHHWNILKEKIAPLSELILQWTQLRHVVSLNINEESENFFLKTSVTQTNEHQYLIVSLETIQQLIDKKEKEAWFKLMNVMSHEIINTITPISSLAENLELLLQEESVDNETLLELSKGLQIIKKRSKHLNSFVDTYRKLAELPLPEKETINISELIQNTLNLFEQEFKTKHIEVDFDSSKTYQINADKEQIEQVVINIISNCLYALEQSENPKISIAIHELNSKMQMTITDNGSGIPDKIKDNIFIPYFTTRKNGSGIGLTLAKSIMEAHNGNIHFKSGKDTTFILTFSK